MRIKRSEIFAHFAGDPILSFDELIADLGCSKATFHRGPRHELPVVQISERRLGVRQSDYERWKASKIQAPARAA
ncbi:hypothetical protein [Geminicoccus harenae]|uniref:hypothetical protein n=1 Tax=Geminicoccus harenae TaxID=2498453 RepID=UPI00168A6EAA|nr:hypothetical protein [Geminicoccus harenae]